MISSETPSQAVQPGDILAEKYRVERVLGQGGMGVVVLAEHLDLRERVAIKFLLDTPNDNAELAERFLREARAAVKIKSEHVVRVIDVGRLPTGAPYMVMEYLEGQDLSQRLLAGRVPIEDAVDYVIQSCEAMHVAHRSGIVHRDLKPANLFLTQRPDGSALVKVLDFGISKVKSTDASQLSLTHTQTMMGSPLYMSPEQMRSSKDVSPAADIWSLGVILHELISGDVPFTGSTFPEVLVQVMSEPPPKLRALRPEVPEGLEAVVLRCLEKHPADRFSSVAALGVALTPFASSRTLGLQARLRTSVSRPAPAVAVAAPPPGKLVESTQVVVDTRVGVAPEAMGLTSPAQAPEAGSPPAAPPSREHAKTNTAWAEQSADAATRGPGSRRRWFIGAGALAAAVLAAALLLRPSGGERVAPAAAPAPTRLASPKSESAPAASDSAVQQAPKVAPVVEAGPAPTPPAQTPPASAPPTAALPSAEPSAAPAEAAKDALRAGAPDEHTSAPAPTATTPDPVSPPATPRPTARRAPAKPNSPANARTRAAAPTPAKAAASAHATREQAPPPAAKPASPPAKSKPLSIEFK